MRGDSLHMNCGAGEENKKTFLHLLVVVVVVVSFVFVFVFLIFVVIFFRHDPILPVYRVVSSAFVRRSPEHVGHPTSKGLCDQDTRDDPCDVCNVGLSESVPSQNSRFIPNKTQQSRRDKRGAGEFTGGEREANQKRNSKDYDSMSAHNTAQNAEWQNCSVRPAEPGGRGQGTATNRNDPAHAYPRKNHPTATWCSARQTRTKP